MAKFYGIIGYSVTEEEEEGNYKPRIVERNYYGDVIRNMKRAESSSQLNDNVGLSNEISIIADPYALNHCYAISYVYYMGVKWKVRSVEVKRPRLILSLGDVYNE